MRLQIPNWCATRCRRGTQPVLRLERAVVVLLLMLIWAFVSLPLAARSETSGSRFQCPNTGILASQFEGLAELETFLRTAEIIRSESVGAGVTHPTRITLESGGLRLRAIFRDVNVRKREGPGPEGKLRLKFRDCSRYECAAYRLDRLLGFDSVPPTVMRRIGRHRGSVQLWVEDAFTEAARLRTGIRPDQVRSWVTQFAMLRLFDELIANDDRNAGNILIDRNWKLWFIDHTRAFRTDRVLRSPSRIRFCARFVWDQLRGVTDGEIRDGLRPFLEESELESLILRRRLIREMLEERILKYGEYSVLF